MANSSTRRFSQDEPPHPCLAAVPHEFWPTRMQFDTWWEFIDVDMAPTEDGWFMAWCPIHDPQRKESAMSGMIQFKMGSLRCLREESCCAPKRSMSLTNVLIKAGTTNGTTTG